MSSYRRVLSSRISPSGGFPTLSLCHFLGGDEVLGWRGCKVFGGGGAFCDAALLRNAGLWTAARLAPAWLLGGNRQPAQLQAAHVILLSVCGYLTIHSFLHVVSRSNIYFQKGYEREKTHLRLKIAQNLGTQQWRHIVIISTQNKINIIFSYRIIVHFWSSVRCLSQYEPAACHLNSTGMINGWIDVIQGSIMSKSLKVFQRRFLLGLEFRSSKCGVFSVKGLGRTDVLKKKETFVSFWFIFKTFR